MIGVRRYRPIIALAFLAVVAIGTALVLTRPAAGCPAGWSDVSRIDLGTSFGDLMLDGRPYRVGGSALLDYMPRAVISPLDRLRASRHPLTITATISAPSRDALGAPEFECFRAIRGGEIWAARPITYATQTLADGYPPGAQPPVNNEAWRLAVLNDGPEWPDGEQISLELWATVHGRRYIFVVPPFALMRGG